MSRPDPVAGEVGQSAPPLTLVACHHHRPWKAEVREPLPTNASNGSRMRLHARWWRRLRSHLAENRVLLALQVIVVALTALLLAVVPILDDRERPDPRPSEPACRVDVGSEAYCAAAESSKDKTEQEILRYSSQFADRPPVGSGPWPYVVVGTQDLGLRVRSTNVDEGVSLGALAPLATAWALCRAESSFDPDPPSKRGAVWLKVKWDQIGPSDDFHDSRPSASATGWAYAGYLVPVGHNGSIPDCR